MYLNIVELNHIYQSYDAMPIFEDASLKIRNFDRIGLVGNNGSGKTTLVKIIMGEVPVDSGSVFMDPDCRIGYLRQVNEQKLSGDVTYETLSKIGFKVYKDLAADRMEHLSGGERTKYQLGKLFEDYYDLILLDEPTNHLDYDGRLWLLDKLENYGGAYMVISHDRYFLDEAVDTIVEVNHQKLDVFDGNYSSYVVQKEHQRLTRRLAYEKQEQEKERIRREISQLKQWSDKGHRESTGKHLKSGAAKMGSKEYFRAKVKKRDKQVKSKIKQLEKVDLTGVDRPEDLLEIRFRFGSGTHNSKKVLSVEGVTKRFGERVLFEDANFYVFKGQRIGLVGANGTGKSTLINMIRGLDRAFEGSIYLNTGQKVAYISQDILDMDGDLTVLQLMDLRDRRQQAEGRRILAQMGIVSEKVGKKICQLSMGERTRVKIAKLIVDEVDFLILDEPTNHLDLTTKATLEQALNHFDGTVLLCSHDRSLIENVCDGVLVIEDKRIAFIDDSPENYYNGHVTIGGDGKSDVTLEQAKLRLMILEANASEVLGRLAGYAPGSDPYLEASASYEHINQEIQTIKGMIG